jgi:DNA repair exonuclease SbcCD ATPase subunit
MAALGEWRQLPRVGERPHIALADDEQATVEQLKTITDAALNALVEARAAHLQVTRERDAALAANNAMRELTALFRREASLRVATEATDLTLKELLDDTIRPLAAEVNQRWKSLFPGRGELDTASSGNITRTVNGHSLPYDSFSTGEGTSLTILLRLLVAQITTSVSFCWFDEPLEHLDPEVRRVVANLLSQVTGENGPLRQVVVTTYEERLARLLHARDEHQVTLIDVRQASRHRSVHGG